MIFFSRLFSRFILVGLTNTSVNYILFLFFITYNFSETSSIIFAYIISSIIAFILHKNFVFHFKGHTKLDIISKYFFFLILNLFLAFINLLIYFSLIDLIGNSKIAYFISISFVTVISFLCFRNVIFK